MFSERRGRSAAGFTLIELLVVMTVLAATAALLVPRFATQRPADVERVAVELVRELGAARSWAVQTGRVQQIAAEDIAGWLPEALSLASPEPPVIVFWPDGTSNGAVWRIDSATGARIVAVDWLTGRVTRHEP